MDSKRRQALRAIGCGCVATITGTAGCVSDFTGTGDQSEGSQTDVNVETIETPDVTSGEPSIVTDDFDQPERLRGEVTNSGIAGRVATGAYWTADPDVGNDAPVSEFNEVSVKTHSIDADETITVSHDVSDVDDSEQFKLAASAASVTATVVNEGDSGSARLELEQDGTVVDTVSFEIEATAEREFTLQLEKSTKDFDFGVIARNDV